MAVDVDELRSHLRESLADWHIEDGTAAAYEEFCDFLARDIDVYLQEKHRRPQ